MKRAVFPGSFDPVTLGHVNIVGKAAGLFDEVVVLAVNNSEKRYMFDFEQRAAMVRGCFDAFLNVRVDIYDGLVVQYMRQNQCRFLVKGVRNAQDYLYEAEVAACNRLLDPNCETVLLIPDREYAAVSSTFVREVIRYGGMLSQCAPQQVVDMVKNIK